MLVAEGKGQCIEHGMAADGPAASGNRRLLTSHWPADFPPQGQGALPGQWDSPRGLCCCVAGDGLA